MELHDHASAYLAGIITFRLLIADNRISHRESKSAPYCTVVIFPEKAFYTPNILSTDVPANLPMLVFHHSSDVYDKLKQYFEFLWWVNKMNEEPQERKP